MSESKNSENMTNLENALFKLLNIEELVREQRGDQMRDRMAVLDTSKEKIESIIKAAEQIKDEGGVLTHEKDKMELVFKNMTDNLNKALKLISQEKGELTARKRGSPGGSTQNSPKHKKSKGGNRSSKRRGMTGGAKLTENQAKKFYYLLIGLFWAMMFYSTWGGGNHVWNTFMSGIEMLFNGTCTNAVGWMTQMGFGFPSNPVCTTTNQLILDARTMQLLKIYNFLGSNITWVLANISIAGSAWNRIIFLFVKHSTLFDRDAIRWMAGVAYPGLADMQNFVANTPEMNGRLAEIAVRQIMAIPNIQNQLSNGGMGQEAIAELMQNLAVREQALEAAAGEQATAARAAEEARLAATQVIAAAAARDAVGAREREVIAEAARIAQQEEEEEEEEDEGVVAAARLSQLTAAANAPGGNNTRDGAYVRQGGRKTKHNRKRKGKKSKKHKNKKKRKKSKRKKSKRKKSERKKSKRKRRTRKR